MLNCCSVGGLKKGLVVELTNGSNAMVTAVTGTIILSMDSSATACGSCLRLLSSSKASYTGGESLHRCTILLCKVYAAAFAVSFSVGHCPKMLLYGTCCSACHQSSVSDRHGASLSHTMTALSPTLSVDYLTGVLSRQRLLTLLKCEFEHRDIM